MPTTYGADLATERAKTRTTSIVQKLILLAPNIHRLALLVQEVRQKADPSYRIVELNTLLLRRLDEARGISEAISNTGPSVVERPWWLTEKLPRWLTEMPTIEAAVQGTVTLLESWAKFDPKVETQSAEAEAAPPS